MIEQIYLSLILIGVTIGAVLAALWRRSRLAIDINLGLIRLNEECNFDTPVFLRAAWTLLSQAGLQGISWKLDWFGVVVEGSSGLNNVQSIQRELNVGEMKLSITLCQRNRRGEQRYFDETLIETFFLLLRTDMLIKENAIVATFAQMSKVNLFLQHDMKNIAQFIQLLADQIAVVPEGKELQVLGYLRNATPLIRHRADRIVNTLTAASSQAASLQSMSVNELLSQLCKLHGLEFNIEGDAIIHAPLNTIDNALENILKNYSDIALRQKLTAPRLSIEIKKQDHLVQISISASNMPAVHAIERLFEPFWTSNPAGLGIGLYQAKQILETHGGSLRVTQDADQSLWFHIEFPSTQNATCT